ncbi:hypothetical protein [Subtercola sp. RTI3]|uniref:arsenate reductase/protein-tyrosine-phosphatase family protein n=1 Tax=Subtercola sp. RTI3 TaxID=3048639 RepID=UPI003A598835
MFVCTGNICRSPMAEQLLRARVTVDSGPPVSIASAGLNTVDGVPMDSSSAQQSVLHGGVPDEARSRKVSGVAIERQDLILTMTRAHQIELLGRYPMLLSRVFVLREFAFGVDEILRPISDWSSSDAERRNGVLRAASIRSRLKLADSDISDPFRKSDAIHSEVGLAISRSIDLLSPFFRPRRQR